MKKIILILCLTALSALCAFTVACEKDNTSYVENGEIVVGGENTGTKDPVVTIYQAEDLHISASTEQSDLTINAYVLENGLKVNVQVDFSAVTFGTPGEYVITYSYAGSQVEKKVYIYGVPQIFGENTVSTAFSKAPTGIFDGITAKDSFGKGLDLQVINEGGMVDPDGSFNVGEFEITIVAVDRAGQSVYFDRTVTITEERNPEILDSYSFDVNDQNFTFTLLDEDKTNFIGVSFGGKAVSGEFLTVNGNDYSVDKTFFYQNLLSEELVSDLVDGDKYVMSVLTSKGKTKTEFILKDTQDIVYDDAPVTTFAKEIYPCFTPIRLAGAKLLNPYQNVTPEYALIKDGVRTTAPNGYFTFDKDGEWTLEINLRGTKVTKTLEIYYDLGLNNGEVFSANNPFTNRLPQGYTLVEYAVTERGNMGAKYLSLTDASKIDDFSGKVAELNTSKLYDMVVTAVKDGKSYTQTANFSVVKDGQAVLSSDTLDMEINNVEYTYLKYTSSMIGGRRGVYRWGANKAGDSGDKSKLIFGEETRNAMKKDYYLTFDIYYTSRVVLMISFGEGYSYYAWGRGSFYASRQEDIDAHGGKTSGVHNSDSYYCGDLIKFFNADGNEIIRKNEDDDPLMYYKNQWITVQFKIETSSISSGAGIHMYTANSALDLQDIYLANIRVSSKATMEDITEMEILPENGVIEFPDIWKKEND